MSKMKNIYILKNTRWLIFIMSCTDKRNKFACVCLSVDGLENLP